jgi:hypothetical protein
MAIHQHEGVLMIEKTGERPGLFGGLKKEFELSLFDSSGRNLVGMVPHTSNKAVSAAFDRATQRNTPADQTPLPGPVPGRGVTLPVPYTTDDGQRGFFRGAPHHTVTLPEGGRVELSAVDENENRMLPISLVKPFVTP